ncbi:MAG: metallophosphoesterase [Phycisphaerae bacterium]|nr:metallophosphoesterase [Phycisphaerae bacterium]
MTDLHFRSGWAQPFDELIERVRADPPDLILFTGDLVEHHFDPRPAYASAGRLVSSLTARYGKFAILGNHDGDLLGPMFMAWGLHLLNAGIETLTINGAPVELVGVPGVRREDLTERFLLRVPPHSPDKLRIVLAHYPDTVRQLTRLKPDLVLSGHTHGGQLCLPGGIPIITHDRLPRRMSKGVHRVFDTWLVVSRGLGFSGFPVRTFCPAEIVEIVIEETMRSER